MSPYMIIAVLVLVLALVLPTLIRSVLSSKLTGYLYKKDFESFDRLADKKIMEYFIAPFNMDFMRLNRALLKGNGTEIDLAFKRFDGVRLSEEQKEAVYLKAFEYYASVNNRGMVRKYYNLIQQMDNEDLKKDVERGYDIYVLKGWRFLDQTLEELDHADEDQRGLYETLIATMYANKGDKENEEKFSQMARKHLLKNKKE